MIPDVVRFRQADLLGALHRRFGPVVRMGPYTYLLGAEANRFVFANSELFEVERAFQSLVPVDGPTSLIVSDGEDHKRRRRLVQPALVHRQIANYVPVMRANAEETLDAWRPGQTVDVYQEFRRAIRRSTIHALFGEKLAQDAEFFGAHLQVLINLIDRNPAVVTLLRTMKAPAWRNAMRARRAVDARVYKAIEETRQGDTAGDVLTSLVQSDGLSDLEVRDQVVTLIAAGYETTSGAMAWAVFNLLRHNGVWERAQEDDDYLANVVNETLRLYPPAVVSARVAAQPFEFAGKKIKQGTFLLYSPYVTHRLAEVWPDPLRFDPDRWERKPAPHEFLPFGGGPHRCIGAGLATTELTVMLKSLLQRPKPELLPQRITPTSVAAMRPKHGLRIRAAG
ncbi:cytochrome P450 [Lentzea sp. BCCO 10_0856]|uniref:Cytochrome P450 n=1 Tax=Lentzea miocenica TaxID=3095431 RepID=A0ABU4T4K1_9PSEU|nr:cytochrome P450 [Lentzea sp. BCCO 10_0856]MDX8033095.1 cytochrome P450 [Lentzea sp. BCCO 10_0856]